MPNTNHSTHLKCNIIHATHLTMKYRNGMAEVNITTIDPKNRIRAGTGIKMHVDSHTPSVAVTVICCSHGDRTMSSVTSAIQFP